ncbi:MAG: hypothetical protein M3O70_20470 [Actinomycetota bacterium]|nr:hypothetical protein [Actinomycetota bacterium]
MTVHHMVRGYLHLAEAVNLGRSGRRAEAEREFAAGDLALGPVTWYRHHARRLVAERATPGSTRMWSGRSRRRS